MSKKSVGRLSVIGDLVAGGDDARSPRCRCLPLRRSHDANDSHLLVDGHRTGFVLGDADSER